MTVEQLFRIRLSLGRRMRTLADPLGITVTQLLDRALVVRFAPRGTR